MRATPETQADATLDTLIATTSGASASTSHTKLTTTATARGTIIGRFVVLSKLGAGAMGLVLAAYDPELDRKVALKLLKFQGDDHEAARIRLQREAQALAKLDHPNVVGVYDVGVHGDQLFVAMEFIEGQTLGEWINAAEQPRPWPEIIRVFSAAGRGLAAAHDAGLVHRDFKPDNVMLGADGRVRVMDFGLARADGGPGPSKPPDPAEPEGEFDIRASLEQLRSLTGSAALSSELTQAGMLIGTPAYMSPEQIHGQHVDARSDQFGFCVALYQALYGERPYAGETVGQIAFAIFQDKLQDPPKGSSVPTWLRKIVVRGLAQAPAERFESMSALLDALADDPARRRRKWWIAGAAVAVLAGASWGLTEVARQRAEICMGMDAKLVGTWDDERRAAVEAAIRETKLGYAADTWVRVEHELDDYTARWVAARTEACRATQQGEQSGELLDLRMACLDERLRHVHATVEVLAHADEGVVERAVQAVASLPSLARCSDTQALTAEIPPPENPAVAERVAALEAKLVEAKAEQRAGRYEPSLASVDAIVSEALELGYEPLTIRAWLQQAALYDKTGDYAKAEATLARAYGAAIGQRMIDEAASASGLLVAIVGARLARHDDAQRWALDAEPFSRAAGTDEARELYLNSMGLVAAAQGNYAQARENYELVLASRERALGPEHLEVAYALANLGTAARSQGDYEQARAFQERALEIKREALGPNHPDLAYSLSNLGNVARAQGRYDEARDYHERALAIAERALGPEHVVVAHTLNNLGTVVALAGDYAKARALNERALAIREGALGPEHPDVAVSFNNLGNIAELEGDLALARENFERALAIREHALGPAHPKVASTLSNLGKILAQQGELVTARAYHQRALAIESEVLGPEHPDIAYTLSSLGAVAQLEGNYQEARELAERALKIRDDALGPEHPLVGNSLLGLGLALLGLGDASAAIPQLERALTIADPSDLAALQFALARALWDAPASAGRDRERALTLAELARVGHREAGPPSAAALEQVEVWLAAHPR